MGSTGSGTFSDYSGQKPSNPKTGGTSDSDDCDRAFSCQLEEVSRCAYYLKFNSVPSIDTEINIIFNGRRLAAVVISGEEVGYLPTEENRIKVCMESGFNYHGNVSNSALLPVPSVGIDVVPQ